MTDKIKIYCINLKRAVERRAQAEKEFQRIGIRYEFIEAVDGKDLTDDEIARTGYNEEAAKRLRNIYKIRGLSRLEIACSLSHLKVYNKIVRDNAEVALIAEDDAFFNFDAAYLDRILAALPDKWEICFLFHRGLCKRINHYICRFQSFPGSAVCYLLSTKGAEKLLELAKPLRLAPDILIGRSTFSGFLNGYGVFPVRVIHADNNFSFLLGSSYKKRFLKDIYHFWSNHFLWVRRVRFFLSKEKKYYMKDLH